MTLVMVARSSSVSWSRSAKRASTWLLGALSGRRSHQALNYKTPILAYLQGETLQHS